MRWRPIPGFPGYEASDAGQVRNARTLKQLAISPNGSGYLRVKPMVDGRQRSLAIHRAVLLAFRGPPPTRRRNEGAHRNSNHHDNRLENLVWKTRLENERDKRAAGTAPREFRGYRLPTEKREAILAELATGRSFSAVARQHGLHRHSVARIARRAA